MPLWAAWRRMLHTGISMSMMTMILKHFLKGFIVIPLCGKGSDQSDTRVSFAPFPVNVHGGSAAGLQDYP